MECDVIGCNADMVAVAIRLYRAVFPSPVEVKVAVCATHALAFGQYGETVVFVEPGRHEYRNAMA